jgi:hypothetical protein
MSLPLQHEDVGFERAPSTSPSPLSAREPTPSSTFQRCSKRKYIPTSKSIPRRKKITKKRVKKDLPKLPYHLTPEETDAAVTAQVKAHFAPKIPLPKEVLDPEVVKKFVDNLGRPQESPISDYVRSLSKSVAKRRKKVAQLRTQENQSVPPLKVFSDEELAGKYQSLPPVNEASIQDYERLASELGMTVNRLIKEVYYPKDELAYKYALRESLVRPEQVDHLPTQM